MTASKNKETIKVDSKQDIRFETVFNRMLQLEKPATLIEIPSSGKIMTMVLIDGVHVEYRLIRDVLNKLNVGEFYTGYPVFASNGGLVPMKASEISSEVEKRCRWVVTMGEDFTKLLKAEVRKERAAIKRGLRVTVEFM